MIDPQWALLLSAAGIVAANLLTAWRTNAKVAATTAETKVAVAETKAAVDQVHEKVNGNFSDLQREIADLKTQNKVLIERLITSTPFTPADPKGKS